MSDFFDPSLDRQTVLLIDAAAVRTAELMLESCESCNEEGAEIPFDAVLDCITKSEPAITEYLLEVPARCPNCQSDVLEKTLVVPYRPN